MSRLLLSRGSVLCALRHRPLLPVSRKFNTPTSAQISRLCPPYRPLPMQKFSTGTVATQTTYVHHTSRQANTEASQNQYESGPSSKDHSTHREPNPEAQYRARMFSIATGAACAFFGASYILYRQLKLRASELATHEVNGIRHNPY